jgi:RNA polymerase sigma-70 factor (ECF subfamily)
MEQDLPLPGHVNAEQRFDAVMEKYGRLLRAAIRGFCPRDMTADSDDIAQEAYLRVWRAVASGREIPSPASYLYRVAATATIDAIRRAKARREATLDPLDPDADARAELHTPPEEGPEQVAAARQLVDKCQQVLRSFTIDRRRAVALHLQGLTTEEIGRLLGWSEAKARNLIYRALRDLRERLHAEGIEK